MESVTKMRVAQTIKLHLAFWGLTSCLSGGVWAQQQQPPSSPSPGDQREEKVNPPAPDSAPDPETLFPHFTDTRYWLSGQANFIFQTHPPFHALYSGPNSLNPNYEKALSRVLTLSWEMRLE